MKTPVLILSAMALCLNMNAGEQVKSPDGRLVVDFDLAKGGIPTYCATFAGEQIVKPSHMGFILADSTKLDRNFAVTATSRGSEDDTWTPVWGENSTIRNHYNSLTVDMAQPRHGIKMNIEFRVYNDGFAFRYIFPEQTRKYLVIDAEKSQFAMADDDTAWWIPGDYDTQEYEYIKSKISEIPAFANTKFQENASATLLDPLGVQTSLMLKTPSGKYLNIHEAKLIDFPAMHLSVDGPALTFTSALTPGIDGHMATIATPFETPWRVVMTGDKATDILATNIIYNLNDPCALDDTSWIHPTKFMGIWWGMITGANSWAYTDAHDFDLATFDYSKAKPNGRHLANNEDVRRYIDFAAENGMDQLLVEGWNIGWEDWFGKGKDYVFDFQTPYPDFDIKALNDYAHSKGIKLMMHHETSGSPANYERFMDDAYDLMNRYGYDAVKSGYVGNILPAGSHHYDQRMVRHYLDAVKRAADKHIMVDAHEAVRPTGLARTYPNLVGNESAMGQEYQHMSMQHCTILPFTRLKGGPMDFTPGIFEMDLDKTAPGNTTDKKATIANQLGLYMTMYSPLQMAADTPENYAKRMDAFQFIKDVPLDWSISKYIDAEPGEFIVVARKDKNSENWYAGGVNAEEPRNVDLALDFLEPGVKYEATIYADGKKADAITNPHDYKISHRKVTAGDTIKLRMARGGGFAIEFKKL